MDSPARWRARIRSGEWDRPTAGLVPGYVQANVVILPERYALSFLQFCERNPKPCPLVDVTDPGDPTPRHAAPRSDLRTDVPRYRVYRYGELTEERTDIRDLWTSDLVGFLLGCSFTFEAALLRNGIPLRHLERGCNVPMYVTNRMCVPAGPFSGPLVVSMRPIPAPDVDRAVRITARYPLAHGSPVHVGDPARLGIADLARPDYGDPVPIQEGEVPVFWACGVTPQAVAQHARLPLLITHAPGHMFLTDLRDEDLAEG